MIKKPEDQTKKAATSCTRAFAWIFSRRCHASWDFARYELRLRFVTDHMAPETPGVTGTGWMQSFDLNDFEAVLQKSQGFPNQPHSQV
ncbi:hypothetical protein CEXT_434361 [Caerostris extrusa]|uniref:Uncharacterized protein n=1 Tax=Caerostris extrusa TaxID=172846 RepID=A0AAV4WXS3_CAEEX|nr:hypothetical protein CEXT_434361 [Caerostris extrusa]